MKFLVLKITEFLFPKPAPMVTPPKIPDFMQRHFDAQDAGVFEGARDTTKKS